MAAFGEVGVQMGRASWGGHRLLPSGCGHYTGVLTTLHMCHLALFSVCFMQNKKLSKNY